MHNVTIYYTVEAPDGHYYHRDMSIDATTKPLTLEQAERRIRSTVPGLESAIVTRVESMQYSKE